MADYMSDRGKSAGSLRLTPSGDDGDAPPVLVEQRSPGRRLRCCACGRACAPDEFDDAERGRVPDDRMCRRCAKMGARHGDSSGAPLPKPLVADPGVTPPHTVSALLSPYRAATIDPGSGSPWHWSRVCPTCQWPVPSADPVHGDGPLMPPPRGYFDSLHAHRATVPASRYHAATADEWRHARLNTVAPPGSGGADLVFGGGGAALWGGPLSRYPGEEEPAFRAREAAALRAYSEASSGTAAYSRTPVSRTVSERYNHPAMHPASPRAQAPIAPAATHRHSPGGRLRQGELDQGPAGARGVEALPPAPSTPAPPVSRPPPRASAPATPTSRPAPEAWSVDTPAPPAARPPPRGTPKDAMQTVPKAPDVRPPPTDNALAAFPGGVFIRDGKDPETTPQLTFFPADASVHFTDGQSLEILGAYALATAAECELAGFPLSTTGWLRLTIHWQRVKRWGDANPATGVRELSEDAVAESDPVAVRWPDGRTILRGVNEQEWTWAAEP